jgi:hypothetical protein
MTRRNCGESRIQIVPTAKGEVKVITAYARHTFTIGDRSLRPRGKAKERRCAIATTLTHGRQLRNSIAIGDKIEDLTKRPALRVSIKPDNNAVFAGGVHRVAHKL